MYNNYIFDLYGTLVDIRTDEGPDEFWQAITDYYASNGAIYESNVLKARYAAYCKKELIVSKLLHPTYKFLDINLISVFDRLYTDKFVETDMKLLVDTAIFFRKTSTEYIRLYDGVIDLLDTLKRNNKHIYLLSNAQRSFTVPELKQLGIYNYFDGIQISSDLCCSKPDIHFYSLLFNKYNLNKPDSIMIGNDWRSDILGSHNFGIDSLYIHQDISPSIDGIELVSKWSILDGDVTKIKELIIKE